ncbi:MAG: Lrp/AsnC family transcriptional regulator [Sphingobacteriales bacterium]|nr:MAG: Lrp/AsnC family transcriptional regulator [Sphingobacteriales bacterium]
MTSQSASTADIPTLDQTDLAILRILEANARISVKELAAQVSLSPTPVHERIRRLEATGVIRQYQAVLDARKLGKSLMVICYVSLKEHSKRAGSKFIEAVMTMDAVVECLTISGQFDFLLKVVCRDMDDYYHFHVNDLSALDNVANVQSTFVMGVVKQTYRLL